MYPKEGLDELQNKGFKLINNENFERVTSQVRADKVIFSCAKFSCFRENA